MSNLMHFFPKIFLKFSLREKNVDLTSKAVENTAYSLTSFMISATNLGKELAAGL
jgi:hypothetical protein